MKIIVSLSATSDKDSVWVIGDTHGCLKTLKTLYKEIKPRRLYMLGDYIDRGSNSKGVIDFIMSHPNIIPIRGNHEQMMLDSLEDAATYEHWLTRSGGDATLKSFGVDSIEEVPKKYIKWMRNLPLFKRYGDNVMSHAGLDFTHKRPLRNTETNVNFILWNRGKAKPGNNRLLIGHTPKSIKAIEKSTKTSTVYLDAGCARGGSLCAFNIITNELVYVPYKG